LLTVTALKIPFTVLAHKQKEEFTHQGHMLNILQASCCSGWSFWATIIAISAYGTSKLCGGGRFAYFTGWISARWREKRGENLASNFGFTASFPSWM